MKEIKGYDGEGLANIIKINHFRVIELDHGLDCLEINSPKKASPSVKEDLSLSGELFKEIIDELKKNDELILIMFKSRNMEKDKKEIEEFFENNFLDIKERSEKERS